ncbi:MAG: 30S ribosomal protein S12 methylthiotransferase RimO [Desulfitobacteriaceae bacterium]
MSKKFAVITLGCPKNQVDSEVMTGLLEQEYDLVLAPEEADVIIVNTCTFIDQAKEESVNTILELAQLKESGKILVATGCLAQRYGEQLLQEIPELDGAVGTGKIEEIVEVVAKAGKDRAYFLGAETPDYLYTEKTPRRRSTPEYYAYVKIAEGCDNFCTYCVIPHVRGRFRSRREESIISEVKALSAEGVKEILLIAQDTTRYGLDLYGEVRLPQLLRRLAQIEGIEWIRLMYCYPEMFTDELIETMKSEPKICRYVDLPLQHGDDKVLHEMNRRGTAAEAEELIHKLRQALPEIVIRTTMITGFPGESEQEFQSLLSYVKRVQFDRLGVFAYSQEEGTTAGRREDQIPSKIRENRREQVMALQYEIALERQRRWVGQTLKVLVEEELPDGRFSGRTQGDAPEIDGQVYIKGFARKLKPGEFVQVRITQADSYDLIGEVVS